MVASLRSTESGEVDVLGSLPLIFYFLMAGLDAAGASISTQEILLAISAILAGVALLIRRQIPATVVFKMILIMHLLITGLDYLLPLSHPMDQILGGLAAYIPGLIVVMTIRAPKKRVIYSSISFALFLFCVGMYWIGRNANASLNFIGTIGNLRMITGIATSILLFMDL